MNKNKWFQLSHRSRLSPFPLHFSIESITKEMKESFGYGYKKVMLIFQGNTYWAFFLEGDYERVAKILFKKVKGNPHIFSLLIKREERLGKIFLKHIRQWAGQDLSKVSNKKLVGFHRQYEKEYKKIYSNYFFILAVERILVKYLFDYILKKFKNQKVASDYFNKLITEPMAMVIKQEEIAALKLVLLVKRNKKWLSILKSRKAEELIRKDKKLYRLIKNHEKKWFWLTRDYEDEILTLADFVRRLKGHLKLDPVKRLAVISQELISLEKEVKKIKINKEHQRLFKAMRDGIYLKELRKSIVSQSLYYYDPILKEIARRGKISLRQVRFLLAQEMEEMIMKGKDFSQILNKRIKLSLYIVSAGITKVIVGKETRKIFKKFCEVHKDVKEIKGLAAAPGKVKGRVKIILTPTEGKKVKPGDIIVTEQATPNFSKAVFRAAGLIADGGTGITSHSATLAREAGIPCITSTKIATKVLKDGDRVEINGDKGIVKILK